MYNKLPAFICVLAIISLSACTGATVRSAARSQNQAYQAQEAVSAQRLEFVEKYQKCVADAGPDTQKVEACDVYLRSAEALS